MLEVMEAVQIASIEDSPIKRINSPTNQRLQESLNYNVSVMNRDQQISTLQNNIVDEDLSSIQILGSQASPNHYL